MTCQHIAKSDDLESVANLSLVDRFPGCPAPATMRLGRRLYCTEHAPKDAVDLDAFAVASSMTVHDKAAEYDRMAEYLRKEGWRVVHEGNLPLNGHRFQEWIHENDVKARHNLFSALKVEHFKDAPRQGERMQKMLAGLDEVMDRKQRFPGEPSGIGYMRAVYARG